MKKIGYNVVRLWVKVCLHLYFGKIKVSGLDHVPKNKPVLFLSNHQNALLDVLLIGVDCNRKPWFLTRSDVFKKKVLAAIFEFFQMIPIYRIRDGRESLKNNQAVFDRCSRLLRENQAILMFPEANHNLKRRVRPLSKGFTRILFKTLELAPDTDIRIVPVGLNYKNAIHFPDQVALFFGKDILIKDLFDATDEKGTVDRIKKVVSDQMKTLTTHIENEDTYDRTIQKLNTVGVDYLNPKEVNVLLKNLMHIKAKDTKETLNFSYQIFKGIFTLVNLPMVLLWRKLVKPKAKEPEFRGTLRFAFIVLGYPIYYVLLFTGMLVVWNPITSFIAVLGLFIFNCAFIKWS